MKHVTRPILDYAPPPRRAPLFRPRATEWGMAVMTYGPIVVALLLFLYLACDGAPPRCRWEEFDATDSQSTVSELASEEFESGPGV